MVATVRVAVSGSGRVSVLRGRLASSSLIPYARFTPAGHVPRCSLLVTCMYLHSGSVLRQIPCAFPGSMVGLLAAETFRHLLLLMTNSGRRG